MFELIYNGIKRLLFGATSVFCVRNGSVPISGNSFVSVHTERAEHPIQIVGIKFQCSPDAQGEFRISTAEHGKIFPFGEINNLDSDYHNLMPIEVAAGELYCIEVRSRNTEYRGIAILEELDVLEMR